MPAPLQSGQESARPETTGVVSQRPALWSTAPAWRNLAIASCLLTSLAISAPMVLPHPGMVADTRSGSQAVGSPIKGDLQPSCMAQIPGAPDRLTGRVTGFVPSEQVLAVTKGVEAQIGAKISPTYLPLKRVVVDISGPSSKFSTFAAVPESMTVKTGDVVEVNSRYRDPNLPCHFIPWTINRLLVMHDSDARP